MRLLVASRFVPLLAFTAVLVGCTDFDRPVVPKRDEPRFSQMAASAAGRIVFHSNRDGPFQIYSMNPDGSGVVRLTYSGVDEYLPLWSPDASRITFGRCYSDHCDVVVIDANGGNERTVLSNAFPGAWSPDGNRIAVGAPGGVYIVNRDGSGVTDITHNDTTNEYGAVYSPDQTQFAFVSDRDGDEDIYVMNADGSGIVNITNNDGIADGGPSWARRSSPANDDFSGAA